MAETTGIDALIKRWDKCISVGERVCREINVLFQVLILNILSFIFIHDLFTDFLSYIYIYIYIYICMYVCVTHVNCFSLSPRHGALSGSERRRRPPRVESC
jgi:hypothetical protein